MADVSPDKMINSMTETLRRLQEMDGKLREDALLWLVLGFSSLLIGVGRVPPLDAYRALLLRGAAGVAGLMAPADATEVFLDLLKDVSPHRQAETPGGLQ